MSRLFVLYEHASGYALFRVTEFEEVAMFLPQVESSVTDLSKFQSVVQLIGFSPFKTAVAALENINAISEGILPHDLSVFLDGIFATKTKKKCTIGVSDPKLGAAITETIEVACSHIGVVPEILRGIRFHFHKLIKGFTSTSAGVAQLGLGHSYSRAKVKFNVHRSDNMIIQSIALLDQLDKDVNTFSMRIREWYSYHFPELVKIIPENHLYSKAVKFIKDRKSLNDEKLDELEEIVMDSAKAKAILDASKSSMGMDISIIDLLNIEHLANRVIHLVEYRKQLAQYLHHKMDNVAPNLQALIGDQVGARLISHAGSLTNLAKYPASTVQILGAEKALFRALKTRTNTPKYGLIYHSTYIGRAGLKSKGRISRFLANKCSIASRIDCFTETPTHVFGEMLKSQVEERLRFYESGELPRKNMEAMKEALSASIIEAEASAKKQKKKKKKKSLTGEENVSQDDADESTTITDVELSGKKKKKKKKQLEDDSFLATEDADTTLNESVAVAEENGDSKKKKKKRKAAEAFDGENGNGSMAAEADISQDVVDGGELKKKKKKNKNKKAKLDAGD